MIVLQQQELSDGKKSRYYMPIFFCFRSAEYEIFRRTSQVFRIFFYFWKTDAKVLPI